jgi:hypothetical protein
MPQVGSLRLFHRLILSHLANALVEAGLVLVGLQRAGGLFELFSPSRVGSAIPGLAAAFAVPPRAGEN